MDNTLIEINLITELIDVCIHNFLYIRNIYPNGIFKKQKKYGLMVYKSMYPPLNEYITDTLKAVKYLNQLKRLKKIEINLYAEIDDDNGNIEKPLETFIIDDIIKYYFDVEGDEHLFEFEQTCAIVLMDLNDKLKNLDPLPGDTRFKINLITTEAAYVKMQNESKEEDPLWMQEMPSTSKNKDDTLNSNLLPVSRMSPINFQLIKHS